MKNGVTKKDIQDFKKIARELYELSQRLDGKAHINADLSVLSLVTNNDEIIESAIIPTLSTGYL